MNKLVFSLSLFLHFLVLVPRVALVHSKMITSCRQTPHPEICNSFVTTYNLPYTFEDYPFKFRDLILQLTMDQAQQAHQQAISNMDVNSFTEQANYAWEDCLELFEDTLHQLNRSIQHTLTRKNMVDTQTWLSAATNNLRTCQNGFIEFNSSSHLDALPFMFRDISKLIGNSLAINKAAISSIKRYRHGSHSHHFPSWVSPRDQIVVKSTKLQADIIVAKDGKGHYRTITEAVAASEKIRRDYKRFVIHVKAGVYKENVEIQNSMKNLMFIGDGMDKTIVTSNRNVHDGFTTFRSATFIVVGEGFIAQGMTFENTAGPEKGQAVALRSDSDFSVFYKCSFKGYQDTLYVHSRRQFYRNCNIYGTVDFIFGDAAAVFQNCNIYVRRPMHGQVNTVTAQGRNDANENTGIIIHNSRVMADYDLKPVEKLFTTYLGRPWQKYSRTVYMKTYLGSLISPAGWLEWNDESALRTLYYGEYMNTGSGADTGNRVKWPGYRVIRDSFNASLFTPRQFFGGYSWISWISGTGVPFTLGL